MSNRERTIELEKSIEAVSTKIVLAMSETSNIATLNKQLSRVELGLDPQSDINEFDSQTRNELLFLMCGVRNAVNLKRQA